MPVPQEPPDAFVGSPEGFAEAVRAVTEEYAALLRERDFFKERAVAGAQGAPEKSFAGPDSGGGILRGCLVSTVCADNLPSSFQVLNVDESPLELRPRSKTSFSEIDAMPRTPRALHNLQGGTPHPVQVTMSEAIRAQTGMTEGEVLQLHMQWLDLYVANQLHADVMDSIIPGAYLERSNFMAMVQIFSGASERSTMTARCGDLYKFLQASFSAFLSAEVFIRPHNKSRIAWDFLSGLLVLYDIILIPVDFAWDREPNSKITTIMLAFWLFDIVLSFNTAVEADGEMVAIRRQVMSRYVQCRFWFDAFLVLLDIMLLSQPSTVNDVAWLRSMRGLRGLRILRAVKLGKVKENIEEYFMDQGVEQFVLIFAVSQTLLSVFIISHVFSCGWYFLGQQEESSEPGSSWLSLLRNDENYDEGNIKEMYLHCLYWVLGHLTGGQVNPELRPLTYAERSYTLCLVSLSLLVIGANISRMTNAIADLQRANMEATDTRRRLSQVLRAANADADLSARIMRFGMYVFRRRSSHLLQSTMKQLLSSALAGELTLSQCSPYVSAHPLLNSIRTEFPNVYLSICEAFVPHIYAEADVIFRSGTLVECLYVTIHGDFFLDAASLGHAWMSERASCSSMASKNVSDSLKLTGLHFVCETSLFALTVSRCTMRTGSFADALTLSAEAFAECAAKSPRCVVKVYRYAAELVRELNRRQGLQENILDFELLPTAFPKSICEKLDDRKHDQTLLRRTESGVSDLMKINGILDKLLSGRLVEHDELATAVTQAFMELASVDGIYEVMNMHTEKKRSIAAMMSIIWLLNDRHDLFTASQSSSDKMSKELWEDMQRFVQWADLSKNTRHALLVFLAIRGIGKSQPLLRAMDRERRTPEDVLVMLMTRMTTKIPSFELLGDDECHLLEQAIEIHKSFNFAQMLQGENLPYHIAVLQSMVRKFGTPVFRFYMVSLVGVMCGLRGSETTNGSLFMDQLNGSTLMAGIHALQWLEQATAPGIYWGYVGERASLLGLPFTTLEDLAVARLACLIRAKSEDIPGMKAEWSRLARNDQEFLIRHFLDDGLNKPAFVLTFLPSFLHNSSNNKTVGLHRAFLVLMELIETLTSNGYLERSRSQILQVSLQDLAEFTQMVENPRVFMAVPGHCSFASKPGRLDVIVSAKHKERSGDLNWCDDPTHEMRVFMRRMERRVSMVNVELEKLQQRNSIGMYGKD